MWLGLARSGGRAAGGHAHAVSDGDASTKKSPTAHPRPTQAKQPEHASKLSELGAHIARVAHELNVPVSLISGSLENLDQYVGTLIRCVHALGGRPSHDQQPDHDLAELQYVVENAPALLKICRDGAQRLTHVVQQVQGYTRRTAELHSPKTVDLATILEEAITLVRATRTEPPTIVWDIQALPAVSGIAESLNQALVNVLANACDAVRSVSDPKVWLSARLSEEPDATMTALTSEHDGRWIEVHVGDNGPGIPMANWEHVFEPFFTTKSCGSGLGLGLAIAREIFESHGGWIWLEPCDHGAEFVIRLPVGGSMGERRERLRPV